jgi:predicted metalloprotease with PDZ domain
MGSHYRHIDLSPGSNPSYSMDLVAESAASLQIDPSALKSYQRLIGEANEIFGGPHRYSGYHFLVTLSDHIAKIAQEHHESSDDRFNEYALLNLDSLQNNADILPHEFVHTWNGKSRRPKGLATPNYQQPMQDDLLWVYEGLTEYLGEVLAARSGAWSPETYRENLALNAAMLDYRGGRKWRPLEDTAVAAQLLYFAPEAWSNVRRATDFYPEGSLVWLTVDTLIRDRTHGQSSLDDFCEAFFGHPGKPPRVDTYTKADLIAALNRIVPFDWQAFFQRNVESVNEHPPLEGIESGGWKLVYTKQIPELQRARERVLQTTDLSYSLGLVLDADSSGADFGTVKDVVMDSPAQAAGISPGMRLIAVAGQRWSPERLRDAIQAATGSGQPIELLIENEDFFTTVSVDYHEGERYPHLERASGRPNLISEIIKPRSQ